MDVLSEGQTAVAAALSEGWCGVKVNGRCQVAGCTREAAYYVVPHALLLDGSVVYDRERASLRCATHLYDGGG